MAHGMFCTYTVNDPVLVKTEQSKRLSPALKSSGATRKINKAAFRV